MTARPSHHVGDGDAAVFVMGRFGGPPACTGFALLARADGVGYWYPGNTNAWYSEGVMPSAWNDRISSVYNTGPTPRAWRRRVHLAAATMVVERVRQAQGGDCPTASSR
ncbi:hypothetical protein OG562_05555 [Streptomyces sp. NBC_01275]|uniref:hypothetical protein n=1 Tax=Streptomyces sp. NBC_01275 TaxID=2903807 RepID=UPI002250DF22|nr:hypothetical protein [Streptomyces sp. NBC_01275]MCX4760444.1 hypothetical protein [Streptomyces sp. NBC_01275]